MGRQTLQSQTKETHSYNTLQTDITQSPAIPGTPTKARSLCSVAEDLTWLYTQSDQPDEKERKARLAHLGYMNQRQLGRKIKESITQVHTQVAFDFNEAAEALNCDMQVLQKLKPLGPKLEHLLAQGVESETVLHVLLDPETYKPQGLPFDKLKPLVRLLLKICPGLPAVTDIQRRTPLYSVMVRSFKATVKEEVSVNQESALPQDIAAKEEIVRYLCGDEATGCLGSAKAIESLVTRTFSNRDDQSLRSHALHKAIENSIRIDEAIVRKLDGIGTVPTDHKGKRLKLSLQAWDDTGKTCLHLALTRPFTDAKGRWAKILVNLEPDLLKATMADDSEELDALTPLQYFTEERRKAKEGKEDTGGKAKKKAEPTSAGIKSLVKENRDDVITKKGGSKTNSPMLHQSVFDSSRTQKKDKRSDRANADSSKDLEDWLKLYCVNAFDNVTARSVMYKRGQMRETYLGFERGDIVSGESLTRLRRHYKLDTTLRCVDIPSISVQWDDHSITAKKKVDNWKCVGNSDFYMIFDWLKRQVGVEKVVEAVVYDFEERHRRSHSDQTIEECLRDLKVEIWNWRRIDISSEVIYNAASEYVKVVHLYCSGIKAVLRSWSDRGGLATLKNLEIVNIEVNQGLESFEIMSQYEQKFREELNDSFLAVNGRKNVLVNWEVIHATDKPPSEEAQISKVKEEGEDGYEEQDWLKCMDNFANFVEELRPIEEPAEDHQDQEEAAEASDVESVANLQNMTPQTHHVKVAIIDDGVKSSVDRLDDLIECGQSWVKQANAKKRYSPYTTSSRGHGTVMAYYIRRVCPNVRLYVAKLNPQMVQNRVTFTIESVTKAIEWAVLENVDIICMSWAIEKKPGTSEGEHPEVKDLRAAIGKATAKNILLFCAHPDKGPGEKNNTYPKNLDSERIFCIGAANKDGNAWGQIGDKSSDFYLPGVDLGIPAETNDFQRKNHPPEKWKKFSGSSLSCALAVGLAAQILYCAQLVGHDKWRYLKTHEGMKQAFEGINVTHNRWLPVRTVFGDKNLTRAVGKKKEMLRSLVVERLLANMDSQTKIYGIIPS